MHLPPQANSYAEVRSFRVQTVAHDATSAACSAIGVVIDNLCQQPVLGSPQVGGWQVQYEVPGSMQLGWVLG